MNRATKSLWDAVTSLKLTIVCLAALMVLVVACTLAQVRLGTLGAVNLYMRSWFYWMPLGPVSDPDLPGRRGGRPRADGEPDRGPAPPPRALLAQGRDLDRPRRAHPALRRRVRDERVPGRRAASPSRRGRRRTTSRCRARSSSRSPTRPTRRSTRSTASPSPPWAAAASVPVPGTPLSVRVLDYLRNAQLGQATPGTPDAGATQGAGIGLAYLPLPPVTNDEQADLSVAVVEVARRRPSPSAPGSPRTRSPRRSSSWRRAAPGRLALRDRRLVPAVHADARRSSATTSTRDRHPEELLEPRPAPEPRRAARTATSSST